jgi:hypothetical protein
LLTSLAKRSLYHYLVSEHYYVLRSPNFILFLYSSAKQAAESPPATSLLAAAAIWQPFGSHLAAIWQPQRDGAKPPIKKNKAFSYPS